MHPRLFSIFAIVVFFTCGERAAAQSYGLTSRPTVGPYLNGTMPTQPPVIGTNWSTVVAFPNLTFLNPLGLLPLPGTTKLVVWEREGRIYSFDNNAATSAKTLMLDLHNQCQGWDDEGLLGLAFSPGASRRTITYMSGIIG